MSAITIRDQNINLGLDKISKDLSKGKLKKVSKTDCIRTLIEGYKWQ